MTAPGRPAASGSLAVLPGGVKLHYRIQGPPGAPWLVLLNGLLSDTTTVWPISLARLAASIASMPPEIIRIVLPEEMLIRNKTLGETAAVWSGPARKRTSDC